MGELSAHKGSHARLTACFSLCGNDMDSWLYKLDLELQTDLLSQAKGQTVS